MARVQPAAQSARSASRTRAHQQFGIEPLSAFSATEMLVAVRSSRSCTGSEPRSDMLNNTRSLTAPMEVGDTPKFRAMVSWHVTPTQLCP